MPLICKACNAPYAPRSGNVKYGQKYCTRRCAAKANKARLGSLHAYPGISTGKVGAIGELRVCVDLLVRGFEVFRSVSQACSCDLVVLKNGNMLRVEVRTSYRSKEGRLWHNSGNVRADVVAAVLPDTIIYEPPLGEFAVSSLSGESKSKDED